MCFSAGDSERGYLYWVIGLASVVDALGLKIIAGLESLIEQIRERDREIAHNHKSYIKKIQKQTPPKPGEVCPCCKVRAWEWPTLIDPDTGHYEHET